MEILFDNKYLHAYFPFGLLISKRSWDELNVSSLNETGTDKSGKSELYKLHQLCRNYNQQYSPDKPIKASELLTARTLVDILRYIFHSYCFIDNPDSLEEAANHLTSTKGDDFYNQPIKAFVNLYPPSAVRNKLKSKNEFINSTIFQIDSTEIVISELTLLFMNNMNLAFQPFKNLHDDTEISNISPYKPFINELDRFFEKQPVFNPLDMSLFECLKAPMKADPYSLDGQLFFIKENWAHFLPEDILQQLLLAIDIIKEEKMIRGFGPGNIEALRFDSKEYGYDDVYPEPAMFSIDADWMSNVVIIAKSVHVWLDQLSKKYQRHIKYLNEIPDEELDCLAKWNFTGLWLIGIWERSNASQKIKQIMGNPEAAPSAYSLYDYVIAEDLGGYLAYQNLKERARRRGIRLASDMVPNHMGIYSKWVVEHPEWFLQTEHPPYPAYQYTGVNLSEVPGLTIQIEDGYWEHRDAAVVFKRIDHNSGEVRYIYHGNDGTSTPWNDTAQLNFMLPEVRETVVQTILHVARMFPIIRFDAAMTLAKKHFQRLWYPKPGDGGAVPSRSEYGMNKSKFDEIFPKEFWREVVDRIAAEAPDTLLLAEAFWLMEGYFVRTLGMHRVYNSAFMNMLKMEDNSKYRQTIKNVLEFSPEILKRFVNFMNNPDEETAIAQFGKGDKYFGIAMMMVTMPGLPMFGHGQLEGFTEKYGMEYRKAYWDETIDDELVRRHEYEIFPLMRKRKLFSGSENFVLYDFITPDGNVDENIFAYSNMTDSEKVLILYNNSYNTTDGHIHTSTAINNAEGTDKYLIRKSISEALNLDTASNSFYSFLDHRTKLTYLRSGKQIAEQGLHFRLFGYQYNALIDFRHIKDHDGTWAKLHMMLDGNGVHNIDRTYQEMILEPVLTPYKNFFNYEILTQMTEDAVSTYDLFKEKADSFFNEVIKYKNISPQPDDIVDRIMNSCKRIPAVKDIKNYIKYSKKFSKILSLISVNYQNIIPSVILFNILEQLESFNPKKDSYSLFDNLMLADYSKEILTNIINNERIAYDDIIFLKQLVFENKILELISNRKLFEIFINHHTDNILKEYLKINRYNDIDWFDKEQMERFIQLILTLSLIRIEPEDKETDKNIKTVINSAHIILKYSKQSEYRIDKFINLLKKTSKKS